AAMPVIGYLSGATFETMRDYVAAFHRGLADAGFAVGRNVAIEYRWAEGHNDRLPALAMDLVRRGVAVIVVGSSTPGALAAKAATQTVPIVFQIGTDPVKVGLVTGLARHGGNITGITIINVELLAKCLELMHNLMPPATTIAVLVNPANVLQTETELPVLQDTARVLGARRDSKCARPQRNRDSLRDPGPRPDRRTRGKRRKFLFDPVRSSGRTGSPPRSANHICVPRVCCGGGAPVGPGGGCWRQPPGRRAN